VSWIDINWRFCSGPLLITVTEGTNTVRLQTVIYQNKSRI
jgi:hypothetical protein